MICHARDARRLIAVRTVDPWVDLDRVRGMIATLRFGLYPSCGTITPVPVPGLQLGACFRFGRTRLAFTEEARMAAMKPRTGDGPLEVTKEGRGIVMRVPLEGGGRLVVEMSADEAAALGDALKSAVG